MLVIIGIMSSFAVLQIGDRGADWLKDEVKRIEILVKLAREEAILEGREYALAFSQQGYAFYQFDEETEGWLPVSDDPTLKERSFPEGLEYALVIEDQELPLAEKLPETPQVFLYSSGEVTPFGVEFSVDEEETDKLEISFDALGRIKEPT